MVNQMWYCCKFCKRCYNDRVKFIQHKKEDHLKECLEEKKEKKRAKLGAGAELVAPPAEQVRPSAFSDSSHEGLQQRHTKEIPVIQEASKEDSESAKSSSDSDSDKTVLIEHHESDSSCADKTTADETEDDKNSSTDSSRRSSLETDGRGPPAPITTPSAGQSVEKITIARLSSDSSNNGKTYSIVKKFRCPHCPKVFKAKCALGSHLRLHKTVMRYKCNVCSKSFQSPRALGWHRQRAHASKAPTVEKTAKDPTGGPEKKSQKVTENLEEVVAEGDNDENDKNSDTWFYQHAFGDFRPSTAMKRALASVRKEKEQHKCDTCNQEFNSATSLLVHQRSHRFNCKYCAKSFDTEEEAHDHKRLHMFEKTYLCPYCPATYPSACTLVSHMAKKHPDKEQPQGRPKPSTPLKDSLSVGPRVTRSIGPRKVLDPSSEVSDIKTKTKRGRKPKLLKPMPAATKSQFVQSKPVRRKRWTLEDQRCNFCKKMFSSVQRRKGHERIHTGERPYKCPQCPKAFTQSHSLKDHIRVHTGERPYRCTLCDSAFKMRCNLVNHFQGVHRLSPDVAKSKAREAMKSNTSGPAVSKETQQPTATPKTPVKKAKIQPTPAASAAAKPGPARPVRPRSQPPPPASETISTITQILVNGLLQYECNICSDRFDRRKDIQEHLHYDHGL